MATLQAANTLPSSASQTSYTNAAFTPVASDYLLCFVIATDCTTDGVMSDSQNLGWDKISSVVSHSTNRFIVFRSKTVAAAVSTTVTWTCDPQLPTACLIATLRIGASDGNIRQVATNTGVAAVTPSVTFAANALTTSAMVYCLVNKTNPHGVSVPTSFTSRNSGAVNGPTTAIAAWSRASGHTSNTITSGGTSASDWTVYGVEILNAGVGHGITGTLVGSGSTVAGVASRSSSAVSHATSGELTGQGSSLSSSASRTRVHSSIGALAGQGSTLASSASRTRSHESSGVLAGQGSTFASSATRTRVHAASSVLGGSGSSISASASRTRIHSTAGELSGVESVFSATALRYRQHDVSGALGGQAASINGLSLRFRIHAAEGSLLGAGANLTGSAASTLETMLSATINAVYEDHLIAATYPSHSIQATLESHTIKGSL